MSTNPLLEQSMLPYQAPRFDRIKDCHYRPAFDEGVRQNAWKSRPSSIIRRSLILRIRFWRWSKAGASVTRHQRFFRDDGRAH